MKKKLHVIKEILSWLLLICMVCLLCYSVVHVYNAKKTGEDAFLFGYRPILVLTGSMEPTMMTNGLALTREVKDLSELAVDDIVTYHLQSDTGRELTITHRIVDITEDGIITTKGDNNNVTDSYPLTMENIEAKVIWIFNGTAWIAAKWQTTAGKVMLICFGLGIILAYTLIKRLLKGRFTAAAPEEIPSLPASDPFQDSESCSGGWEKE